MCDVVADGVTMCGLVTDGVTMCDVFTYIMTIQGYE